MQNLPDKGVSGSLCYLLAEYTVTSLSQVTHESQAEKPASTSRGGEEQETYG
jgi:hypothetical protein